MYLPGAFQLALGALKAEPRITEAFRTGAGFGWHEHDDDVFVGCERFFRPGYAANLVPSWIPALDGVEAKLRAGAMVADVGCGHGASTRADGPGVPEQTPFAGSDYHEGSIELARKRAADAGVADRVSFEVASAQTFGGSGYDLVATFDCLHDMGDPLSAARHIRESLDRDGTWLIVEPAAGDTVADNLNPVGRVYYYFSTSSACRTRSRSAVATRSAPRPARPRSARSRPTPGSPGSAGRPRRRSTSSSRLVPRLVPRSRRPDPADQLTGPAVVAGDGGPVSSRRRRSRRRPAS